MPKHIELRRTWEERIQTQETSGLSIQRWCQENQIPIYSFHYWKRRLSKTLCRSSFIEITEKDVGVYIKIRGVSIYLERHFDPSVLKRCLEVLKSC